MTAEKQKRLDALYMDIAHRVSLMSYGVRAKVGATLVKGDRIISYGWNGTPAGDDNVCEDLVYPDWYDGRDGLSGPPDKVLRTKQTVLHAESNCLMKLAAVGGEGSEGATLYVTMSPCGECAKLIKQARIARVVYSELYRDTAGIDFLTTRGVIVEQQA